MRMKGRRYIRDKLDKSDAKGMLKQCAASFIEATGRTPRKNEVGCWSRRKDVDQAPQI